MTSGRVLGRGGFCVVSVVNSVTLKHGAAAAKTRERNDKDRAQQDRQDMANNCIQGNYALKQVSEDVALKNVDTYVNGIVDLAVESKFLAALSHPNIISIRGMAACVPYSRSFFVVMDRLHDILTVRLITWKKQKPGALNRMLDTKSKKAKAFWLERMNVAHDVASALKYIHSRQYVQ